MSIQNGSVSTGSSNHAPQQPLLKSQYKIQKKLGEGGMGQVFLAIDTLNQRPVAIKSIFTSHKDDQLVQRLSREYRILQMIDHPNVVKGYDFFEENGQMFLVMEFISGVSMKEYIQTNANPPLLEKLAIGNQLCRAIEVLNTAGVLHRDLKPANVMVNKATGTIKLLDMGLGKKLKPSKKSLLLTQQGDIVGTPAYLSPEQVMGKVSEKSDVFALGIVLYQLFAWHKSSPFQEDSSISTMIKISEGKIADLNSQIQGEVSEEERQVYQKVSSMVSMALVKEVDKRLSTARELGDELERLYQKLERSHHRLADNKTTAKSETNWKTSDCIENKELEKLLAFKEEQEKENKKGEINKTPRRNRRKGSESSWTKKLIVVVALTLIFAFIVIKPNLGNANDYYNSSGTTFLKQGKLLEAVVAFTKAIEIKPDFAEAYNNRATAYYQQKIYSKAIDDYSQAIKIKPDFADAYNNRGEAYFDQKIYSKAIDDYSQAIKLKPDFADAYSNRGTAYCSQGMYPEAITDYSQAIKLKPDFVDAYNNRATVYYQLGMYQKAIDGCTQVIKLKPDFADAYYGRGLTHYRQGMYQKAIDDYTQAIKLKPDFADAYYGRGVIYYNQKMYQKAIDDYTQAIKFRPDLTDAYYGRGVIYCMQRKFSREAIADLNKARELGIQQQRADIVKQAEELLKKNKLPN